MTPECPDRNAEKHLFDSGLNASEPHETHGDKDPASADESILPTTEQSVKDLITQIRSWNDPRQSAPGSCIFGPSVVPLVQQESDGDSKLVD